MQSIEATQTAETIISRLIAKVQPNTRELSTSPDSRWQAELMTYPCTFVESADLPEKYAYDILQLIDSSSGTALQIAYQLQLCGGVGAYGLGEIVWSKNSQYYYYTDAREGTPDGGPPGWMRTYYRYKIATHQIDILGPSLLSPNQSEIASSAQWIDGQWILSPAALIVWNTDGQKIVEYETDFGPESWGFHRVAWSPTKTDFVYVETECPKISKCKSSVYYVDRTKGIRTQLLHDWQPHFEAVNWNEPDELIFIDGYFKTWIYSLINHKIVAQ